MKDNYKTRKYRSINLGDKILIATAIGVIAFETIKYFVEEDQSKSKPEKIVRIERYEPNRPELTIL